jgi:hypothetical protein
MRATEEAEQWIASYACGSCGGPAVIDRVADPRGLVTVVHEPSCECAVRLRQAYPGLYTGLTMPAPQGPLHSDPYIVTLGS